MALSAYGILKGNLFTPAEQTYQGTWFHGVFYLDAPGSTYHYRCVTDFSSETVSNIQYKIFRNLNADLFRNVMALSDGFTDLSTMRNSTSGALDYVRSPILGPGGCVEVFVALWNRLFGTAITDGWIPGDGDVAVTQLQALLSSSPAKVYVFGEPFQPINGMPIPIETEGGVTSQLGMHNIHMNQGDPPISPSDGHDHQPDDGIWQDGGTIFQSADGTLTAFCNKFVAQTFATNDQGLPAT